MVSHWETGHRAIPIERIEQIAALFQKPVAYFTGPVYNKQRYNPL
jgi:transcriptional regulator with XRE-family HTH domain